jgi:hypothetical protein
MELMRWMWLTIDLLGSEEAQTPEQLHQDGNKLSPGVAFSSILEREIVLSNE